MLVMQQEVQSLQHQLIACASEARAALEAVAKGYSVAQATLHAQQEENAVLRDRIRHCEGEKVCVRVAVCVCVYQ